MKIPTDAPAQFPPETVRDWFSLALWLAALANFCVLAAGVQLPWRLKWREDLAKLTPFNRKLFRVYYFFVGMTIVAFGTMTFALHDAMLAGDREALFLAGFIGLWWIARIVIDAVYFDHADWPKGKGMAIGHAVLTTTFVALAFTYTALVIWHAV
jgi:hypothetical protein